MDCANNHFYADNVYVLCLKRMNPFYKHYHFSGNWGAFGCDGAWPQAYYDWIVTKNDGRLEKESCEPYQAHDRTCNDDDSCNYMGAHLTGFYNKWYTNEEEMKEIVYAGPVATTVYVSVHQNTENTKLTHPN